MKGRLGSLVSSPNASLIRTSMGIRANCTILLEDGCECRDGGDGFETGPVPEVLQGHCTSGKNV